MDELDNILDPCEQIADALVEYVNGIAGLPVTVQASKPHDPRVELEREHDHIGVYFFPSEETTEKAGRGGQTLESFGVSMLVVAKLDDIITRERMNAFTRVLKLKIRGKKMAGFHWSADETTTKADAAQLRELSQFTTLSTIGYVAMTGALD